MQCSHCNQPSEKEQQKIFLLYVHASLYMDNDLESVCNCSYCSLYKLSLSSVFCILRRLKSVSL